MQMAQRVRIFLRFVEIAQPAWNFSFDGGWPCWRPLIIMFCIRLAQTVSRFWELPTSGAKLLHRQSACRRGSHRHHAAAVRLPFVIGG